MKTVFQHSPAEKYDILKYDLNKCYNVQPMLKDLQN